jgi:hypothetical protein
MNKIFKLKKIILEEYFYHNKKNNWKNNKKNHKKFTNKNNF